MMKTNKEGIHYFTLPKSWIIKSLNKSRLLDKPLSDKDDYTEINGQFNLDAVIGDINIHTKAMIRQSHKGVVQTMFKIRKSYLFKGLLVLFAIALWTYFSVVIWLWLESMP